jgi:hypothetical protein
MQLIKKSQKPILKKAETAEELKEENFLIDPFDDQEPSVEQTQTPYLENDEFYYSPVRDNPVVQSVGNSGWQVSDIWRDIRVDSFCD